MGKKEKTFERKMTGYTTVTINEQNFPEFSPELFSEIFSALLKRIGVCSLSLTGWKILQNKHMDVHTHTHTHIHHHHKGGCFSSNPGGNDDSHYRLSASAATGPLSAALLRYPTALFCWCSIISFPLSFGVHQGVVVPRGLRFGEPVWKGTTGLNDPLIWSSLGK